MKKILVLDDDKDILEILSFILMDAGHDVRTLARGDKVFDEIGSFRPDLLLMDVRLAGMDGRAICRDIKENKLTASLPIILISGTHDLADTMLLPGAPNDYIVKPYDINFLLKRVEQQLTA